MLVVGTVSAPPVGVPVIPISISTLSSDVCPLLDDRSMPTYSNNIQDHVATSFSFNGSHVKIQAEYDVNNKQTKVAIFHRKGDQSEQLVKTFMLKPRNSMVSSIEIELCPKSEQLLNYTVLAFHTKHSKPFVKETFTLNTVPLDDGLWYALWWVWVPIGFTHMLFFLPLLMQFIFWLLGTDVDLRLVLYISFFIGFIAQAVCSICFKIFISTYPFWLLIVLLLEPLFILLMLMWIV